MRLLRQRAADAPDAAGDAHPRLHRAYGDSLRALAAGESQEVVLRRFELALLQELGYGLSLDVDADGGGPGRYPLRLYNRARSGCPRWITSMRRRRTGGGPGKTLLDMAAGDFRGPHETLAQSKALMRRLIQHYLGGQQLQSRRVFTELFAFPGEPS